MKRSICLVLFAVTLSVLSFGYTYADSFQKELLGKWEDENDQNSTVEFLDGGIFFAVVGDQKLTGDYKILKENLFSFSLMGFKGICECAIEDSVIKFSTSYDCAWKGEQLKRVETP